VGYRKSSHLNWCGISILRDLVDRQHRRLVFLADPGPGPERSQAELRTFLFRWLVPLIDEKLQGSYERLVSSE
jgi:hypothetical protein